ncbi:MAG: type II CAAX endopeptidase family protein [Planctomycetota bacterium]
MSEAPVVIVAMGVGALTLAGLLVSEFKRKPIPPRNPEPFVSGVDPWALVLVAFSTYFVQALATMPLVEVRPANYVFNAWTIVLLAGVVLAVILFAWALVHYGWRRIARPMGTPVQHVSYGLLWLLAALPLVYGCALLLQQFEVEQEQDLVRMLREPGWPMIAIYAIVIAPIMEELAFRGFLYAALRQWVGRRQAIVFSALFFGIVHVQGSYAAVAPLTILGLVLALLTERTGSLRPAMIAHGAFNLLTVLTVRL